MSLLSKFSATLRRPFDGLMDEIRRRRVAREITAKAKAAEQRKAAELAQQARLAEERAAIEKAAERRNTEELLRQLRLAEERAAEVEAGKRRKAEEFAQQTRLAQERANREAARQRAIEERVAEQRRLANPFQLGGRYENRKGFFTVISLSDDQIRIRWDTGEEITDTIASQARILHNMQRGEVYLDSEPQGHCTDSENIPTSRASWPDEPTNCAWCGRYVQRPEYYKGLPYGPVCIRHARGW